MRSIRTRCPAARSTTHSAALWRSRSACRSARRGSRICVIIAITVRQRRARKCSIQAARSRFSAYAFHYLRISIGLYAGELALCLLCFAPRATLRRRLQALCPAGERHFARVRGYGHRRCVAARFVAANPQRRRVHRAYVVHLRIPVRRCVAVVGDTACRTRPNHLPSRSRAAPRHTARPARLRLQHARAALVAACAIEFEFPPHTSRESAAAVVCAESRSCVSCRRHLVRPRRIPPMARTDRRRRPAHRRQSLSTARVTFLSRGGCKDSRCRAV